jgi:hypothetical protein
MAFEQLTLGLTLTLPTQGSVNWGPTLKSTTWTKISQHGHTGSGDGNKIAAAALVDNIVDKSKLALNLALNQAAVLTPVGTSQTIDWNLGNIQYLDLGSATGDVTVTLSNPVAGGIYKIWVTQSATPRDIIWPASVKWPQAQKPILSQGNDEIDLVDLFYTGTEYRGQWELDIS